MTVADRIARVNDKWLAMSVRERALVLLTVAAMVVALWHETLVVAMDGGNNSLRRDVANLRSQVEAQQQEQQAVLGAYRGDPNEALVERIRGVRGELADLTRDLEGVTRGLVPPERMPALLDDVLGRHPGVRLVRVENLAPDRLAARSLLASDGGDGAHGTTGAVAADDAGGTPDVAFYRHGLRLVLEGGYGDVVAWLDAVEALPWEFVWQRLSYEVLDHPVARVTVEVQTVSTEDRWIGIRRDG